MPLLPSKGGRLACRRSARTPLTPPWPPAVLADGYQRSPDGLIYKDFVEGSGESPVDGQVGGLLCWGKRTQSGCLAAHGGAVPMQAPPCGVALLHQAGPTLRTQLSAM